MINGELSLILKDEPAYRLKQAQKAVFQDLIEDWRQASGLPKELREKLNRLRPLSIKADFFISKDKKNVKALIELKDGLKIEAVLMRHQGGRNTVCLSSQVGCPLACAFCATGKTGFKRNLLPEEIVSQTLLFSRYLKKENQKVNNLVFMGMGEPFLNYNNVLEAIRTFNDKDGFNLGARHISISTVGIIEGIKKLSQEKLAVNLAISLHAPNDKLRAKLMPVAKKYHLAAIFKAVDYYIKASNRRVMFEYLMIKNLNDSLRQAEELAKLMKKPLYFVNLIRYNQTVGYDLTGIFTPSLPKTINQFKQVLEKRGVATTQRYHFGSEINAACGQLAAR